MSDFDRAIRFSGVLFRGQLTIEQEGGEAFFWKISLTPEGKWRLEDAGELASGHTIGDYDSLIDAMRVGELLA